MYKLTMNGTPFGQSMSLLEAQRRIDATKYAVKGVGMIRVMSL